MLPAAPIIAAAIPIVCYRNGLAASASISLAVANICVMWWIFECTHIAVIGLLPFVAFPLMGILSHKVVSHAYGHTMIMLKTRMYPHAHCGYPK